MEYLLKYKTFENINYAKSILRKKGLDQNDVAYQEILEIVGQKLGYIGILTKLHYIYDVDIEEVKSIFDQLISNKIDLAKVVNLDYIQLSDFLYNLSDTKDSKNYEFKFDDGIYKYYQVYDYEGILEIGSPSWCIKTKSNWEVYFGKSKESYQYVAVKNSVNKNKLLTPNNNYFSKYVNKKNAEIRVGVTYNADKNNFYIFDDNDENIKETSYGKEIISRIKSFIIGNNKTESLENIFGSPEIIFEDYKIWHLNDQKLDRSISYFMVTNKTDLRIDNGKDIILITKSNKFLYYLSIGTFISRNNGSKVDYRFNLDTNLMYSIMKYFLDIIGTMSLSLAPLALKRDGVIKFNNGKILTREDIISKGSALDIDDNWIVSHWKTKDNIVLSFTSNKCKNVSAVFLLNGTNMVSNFKFSPQYSIESIRWLADSYITSTSTVDKESLISIVNSPYANRNFYEEMVLKCRDQIAKEKQEEKIIKSKKPKWYQNKLI